MQEIADRVLRSGSPTAPLVPVCLRHELKGTKEIGAWALQHTTDLFGNRTGIGPISFGGGVGVTPAANVGIYLYYMCVPYIHGVFVGVRYEGLFFLETGI